MTLTDLTDAYKAGTGRLVKEIVSLVDLARDEWPLAFIRELADICCGIRNPHPFTGAQGALDEYARLLPAVWLRAFPQK